MSEPEPLLRVMALHALAFCERLFYLEEVEELRLADEAVFAGRRLHEELSRDEGEWTSLTLESEALGIRGKIDCLRCKEGHIIPYEHKRGHSRRGNDSHEAWPADRLQILAYTLLLEEHLGSPVPEARVRYHADNVTVRIPLDKAGREEVVRAVARAKALRSSVERPPVTANEHLCVRCSLAPVCLPEEERLAQDSSWEPIRLFPPDIERQAVHVTRQGAHVGRSGEMLVVTQEDGTKVGLPTQEVDQLILHGFVQISTQALRLCAEQEIGVHWFTTRGHYIAGLAAGPGPVHRRIRQYKALCDPGFSLRLAKLLARARIMTQLRFLLRATRGKSRSAGVQQSLDGLRRALSALAGCEGIDSLRGYEGEAGRHYFSGLPELFRSDLDPLLRFDGRSRRPPKDGFNALLSFGYGLLYRDVLQAVLAVGLEPAFGFFHRPRSAAHPLVLDLMELFRIPLWDMPLVASVNRQQWKAGEDFTRTKEQVWLSESGRKKAIQVYEQRKEEVWKHPVTGYSLSYARLIELEVRLLEKEWTGQPGLFARMRLR